MQNISQIGKRRIDVIALEIYPQGTSAPVVAHSGGVTSVARADVGLFTVTLDETYVDLFGHSLSVGLADPADSTEVKLGAVDLSAKTVQLQAYTLDADAAAVAADITADDDNRIGLVLYLSKALVS